MRLACAGALLFVSSSPVPGMAATSPDPDRLSFWSPSQQDMGYRSIERIFPTNVIRAGNDVRPLPKADTELDVHFTFQHRPYTTDDFMITNRVSGLLVIKDGRIVLERYAPGRGSDDRWTSFSIAKSVTSILLAAAIRDGAITSIDDPIVRYVPQLAGGVYDGVTLRQMLTMTSGVHWNEDYDDPQSDFNLHAVEMGPRFYRFMSGLGRDAAPGKQFHYSTGESNLLGAAVINATGKSLSDYFSEKIWRPFGMESDGFWLTSKEGLETGGICFSATLRDYGRLGLFILGGGVAGDAKILPDGWLREATTAKVKTEYPGFSYGYQWWIGADGTFNGIGIMGQLLHMDPARRLVVVVQSAWNNAGREEQYVLQTAFLHAVEGAVSAD